MRHIAAIAGRELRSYFVSPVAYAVLTLFAVLGGFLFLASVLSFEAELQSAQQYQAFDFLATMNLNDGVIAPFYQIMWIVLLLLVPGLTMGVFAAEKANGTEELLLTSPITVWDMVLGKLLAAVAMVTLLTAMLAAFTGILFWFGDPEPWKAFAGLLAVWLIGVNYAAIGCFASSITRNQLIAFFLAFVVILFLWLIAVVTQIGAFQETFGVDSWLAQFLSWISTAEHFENLLKGVVDTRDVAYFLGLSALFVLLTKAAVESVRWR